MLALVFCACRFFEAEYFTAEKENYGQYLEAKDFLAKKEYEKAAVELEDLWSRTQSRAILETLVDTYRVNEQYEKGLQKASKYLEQHPGDFELRLMRAKLLLGLARWEEARGDLQIILFNKRVSLWELIQDPDLKPYKDQPELQDILGFSSIQLRQLSHPDGGLVGDILLLDVQVNHLRSCNIRLVEKAVTEQLQIQKIRVNTQKIDEWVVQTQLQINWLATQKGTTPPAQISIVCDDEVLPIAFQPILIEELVATREKTDPPHPFLLLPSRADCLPDETSPSEETVSVQFRANGILEKECLVSVH